MTHTLKIIADAHIWAVESAFLTLPGYDVDLTILENRHITRDAVRDADILLTRSSTRVNADLLDGSTVRFAGTATIGDDHYDKDWLEARHIAWANAAGSSTDSVIEYMVTTLLELHARGLISIADSCIGIIGAGRIGSKLARICKDIGMKVLCNDPPRARAEGGDAFCSLEHLLSQADIVTLHTPLIGDGADCTIHLMAEAQFAAFSGKCVINAGRGGCVDNPALKQWLDDNPSNCAVLDCWENEPRPDKALFGHPGMAIATPHIAGHSIDGKAANTQYIYQALCDFLHIEASWDMHAHLPAPALAHVIQARGDCWQQLHAASSWLYPLNDDDESMKSWPDLSHSELPNAFTGYRRHYPVRRGWQYAPIHFAHGDAETLRLAQAIGINTMASGRQVNAHGLFHPVV